MKKKITKVVSLLLTVVMIFSVFAIVPMTTVSAAEGDSFYINGRHYSQADLFNMSGCTCGIRIGNSGHYCCYSRAGQVYSSIWGRSMDGSLSQDDLLYGKTSVAWNADNIKYYLQLAEPGAAMRFTSNQNNSWGHILIFLQLNSSGTGAWMYNPNSDGKGNCVIRNYTWQEIKNTGNWTGCRYLWFVVWPKGRTTPKTNPVTFSASTGGSSNVSNTNATISGSANASNGSAPYVNSWGYYIGTNNNPTNKKTVGWVNANVSSLSCNIKDQCGSLSPGTTYYYKIWAVIDGKEYTGGVNNFRTTSIRPSASTIRTSTTDIGLGVNPVVTWSGASYADSYTVQLKNSNGDVVQSRTGITGTTYSFTGLNTAGTYTATIYSVNTVGTTQGSSVNITVHPNSTVKFIDVDPETNEEVVVKEQSVVYGQNATAPANPSKTGYTFKRWSGTYTNVKADTNITSVYEINTYTVKFVNSYTGELIKTEHVKYKHSATPPEYELPRGYVNIETGWDKDYTKVLDDTTYYSVIEWGNPDIPMYIDSVEAKRFTDTSTYNNEGYEVTVNLHNWDESLTTGRLIVALMTDDGQLLTETESSAFYLKKSTTKSVEVFVPYKDEVDYIKVFVVDQYSTATPISEPEICDNILTIGSDYSYSYNQAPKAGTYDPDTLTSYTEYRYKTKSTTTSYDTSMAGWTRDGYDLINAGSGTIDYVSYFPSGFDTNNYYYGLYNRRPVSASDTSTSKTTVSTSTIGYLYWHWCRGDNAGAINRYIWGYPTSNGYGNFYTFHAAFRSSALGNPIYSDGYCYQWANSSSCNSTYWWFGGDQYSTNQTVVQRCSYTNYNKRYNYYKWSTWSDWSTMPRTSDSNTQVESRTVYKYIPYTGKTKSIYIDTSGLNLSNAPRTGYTNYAGNEYEVWAWHWNDGAATGYGYFTVAEPDESGYLKTEASVGDNLVFAFLNKGDTIEPTNWYYSITQTVDTSFDGSKNVFVIDGKTGQNQYGSTMLAVSKDKYNPPKDIDFEKTISGTISSEFAGKQAALFIYKVDSASDYTNEYIGQTVIGEDGSYEFNFKLREEPTIETGDFTVVLNLEGATAPIYLAPIVAPKKEHTVKFLDYDYSNYNPNDPNSQPELKVISEQTVEEGEDAELPIDKLFGREGYTFTNWSATATNVHSDLEIVAEYEINEYTVVFVDWNERSVDIQKFHHGDVLVAPQPQEVDAGTLVQWDAVANGETTVTHDMVVCTEYTSRKCNVVITDFAGNVIEEKTVNYGEYVDLPEFSEAQFDAYNLIGWTNEESSHSHMGEAETQSAETLLEDAIITDNCYLCPVYEFEESVLNPKASVSSGEYTTAQTITLSCETPNAQIYYTLDGSDPKSNSGIRYSAPIRVEDKAKLSFYATAIEMNDSPINYEYYVINPVDAQSAWITYDKLPAEVKANPSEYTVTQETGYSYKNIRQTSSSAEYEQLINDGWTYINSVESDVSDYLDEPYVNDDLIGLQNESVDVYGNGYQVSHYKYTLNGVEGICKDESFAPEGSTGQTETAKAKSFGSVAGFDEASGNAPYYLYNGERWYNRKVVQVVVGQQYCYTYQIASLYKWTDYSIEAPSATETRETRSADVYSYEKMKHYIINVYGLFNYLESEIYKVNSKLNQPKELYGFTFEGYYLDGNFTQPIDINTYNVTESTDIFAKFSPRKYTVEFTYMDGTEIETQEVDYLSAATAPEIPDVPNYVFVGWDKDFQHIEGDTTVKAIYVKESEYSSVSLDKDYVNIIEGNSTKLNPIFDNENVALELEWTSSNNNVATVSSEGVVTAVSEGTAVITAKVEGMPESAECTITVVGDTVNKLALNDNSKLDIDKGTGTLRRIKANSNSVEQIIANFVNTNVSVTDSEGLALLNTDLVGTGSVVCLVKDNAVTDRLVVVMTADVSGDGKVNLRDASLISRFLIDDFSDPTDYQIYAMDVNGDGSANNKDAALVLQYLVGKVNI